MLKKIKTTNDVVTLKISTGEEIIGYFVSETDQQIVIRKPVTLVIQGEGVALAPYIMTSDYLTTNEEMPFYKNSVVTMVSASKQFADAYTKQFSGLDLSTGAKQGLIMP